MTKRVNSHSKVILELFREIKYHALKKVADSISKFYCSSHLIHCLFQLRSRRATPKHGKNCATFYFPLFRTFVRNLKGDGLGRVGSNNRKVMLDSWQKTGIFVRMKAPINFVPETPLPAHYHGGTLPAPLLRRELRRLRRRRRRPWNGLVTGSAK